jgi:hypothetical protein
MNDFTKEELGYLSWLINQVESLHMQSLIGDIRHKLKSMIDNYDQCEGNHMYILSVCASCGHRINENE